MSHQRRLRLRVLSSKIQPQSSPPHCLSRERSPVVNNSAAESLTSQRILSREGREVLHVHSNPLDVAVICLDPWATCNSSFSTARSCRSVDRPVTICFKTEYKASRKRRLIRKTLAASLGCCNASFVSAFASASVKASAWRAH